MNHRKVVCRNLSDVKRVPFVQVLLPPCVKEIFKRISHLIGLTRQPLTKTSLSNWTHSRCMFITKWNVSCKLNTMQQYAKKSMIWNALARLFLPYNEHFRYIEVATRCFTSYWTRLVLQGRLMHISGFPPLQLNVWLSVMRLFRVPRMRCGLHGVGGKELWLMPHETCSWAVERKGVPVSWAAQVQ